MSRAWRGERTERMKFRDLKNGWIKEKRHFSSMRDRPVRPLTGGFIGSRDECCILMV